MTARGTWKKQELRIAKDLGGRRIPVTGIDRDGADCLTPVFAVQSKLRASLPDWLGAWMAGIVHTAAQSGLTGLLVLRRPRQRYEEALVVLRYPDFVALCGELPLQKTCVAEPLPVEPNQPPSHDLPTT